MTENPQIEDVHCSYNKSRHSQKQGEMQSDTGSTKVQFGLNNNITIKILIRTWLFFTLSSKQPWSRTCNVIYLKGVTMIWHAIGCQEVNNLMQISVEI